jgi:outer membrane protein OmpA-like peptidoglycan-associated protein
MGGLSLMAREQRHGGPGKLYRALARTLYAALPHATAGALAGGLAFACWAQPLPLAPDTARPIKARAAPETAATPEWTPRLEAKLSQLQRAARGSGIVVERRQARLRIAAVNDEAFAPNSADMAPALRAFLDEMADDGALMAALHVGVVAGTARGGRPDANQRLASGRATAVKRHLQLRGVRLRQCNPDTASTLDTRGIELFIEDDGS